MRTHTQFSPSNVSGVRCSRSRFLVTWSCDRFRRPGLEAHLVFSVCFSCRASELNPRALRTQILSSKRSLSVGPPAPWSALPCAVMDGSCTLHLFACLGCWKSGAAVHFSCLLRHSPREVLGCAAFLSLRLLALPTSGEVRNRRLWSVGGTLQAVSCAQLPLSPPAELEVEDMVAFSLSFPPSPHYRLLTSAV